MAITALRAHKIGIRVCRASISRFWPKSANCSKWRLPTPPELQSIRHRRTASAIPIRLTMLRNEVLSWRACGKVDLTVFVICMCLIFWRFRPKITTCRPIIRRRRNTAQLLCLNFFSAFTIVTIGWIYGENLKPSSRGKEHPICWKVSRDPKTHSRNRKEPYCGYVIWSLEN